MSATLVMANASDPSTESLASAMSPKRGRLRRRLLWFCGMSVFWGLIAYYALPFAFRIPRALQIHPAQSIELTDRSGQPLRSLPAAGSAGRQDGLLAFAHIPPSLLHATISAEDQRFWSHGGIDFLGLARAAYDSIKARRPVSGASTITQQLVKVARGRYHDRGLRDKFIEVFTARRLEMTWGKERIVSEYLSRIEYGNQRVGAAAAAEGYFQKPLADLSLAEAAFLAGLPQAPSRLNPYKNFQAAKTRQEWILDRMAQDWWINQAEADRAAREPLRLRRWNGGFATPHFIDHLMAQNGWDELEATGGQLKTSIDLPLQRFCEQSLKLRLAELKDQNVRDGGVVVMDVKTGEILAMVGGIDYERPDAGQINTTTMRRSAGSTLKPFIYLLAFEQGLTPGSIVHDLPVEFMTPTGLYRPENYDRKIYGPISAREALGSSLNISAVRVLQRIGGPKILMEALSEAGMSTLDQPPEHYGLGLAIGNAEVTLIELVGAYAALMRQGTWIPAHCIAGEKSGEARMAFDTAASWLVADVLSDNQARTRGFGTDSALRLPFPAAVKTGTSTDFRDNWCVGGSPEVMVGVWMGNIDRRPMHKVSGVTGSAPLWRQIMTWWAQQHPTSWPERPPEIISAQVDPLTGDQVPEALQRHRPSVTISCLARHLPPVASRQRYDALGRVILPRDYARWLQSREAWTGAAAIAGNELLPSFSQPALSDSTWHITSPLDGSTYYLDPDLPAQGSRLRLRASGNTLALHWASETLSLEQKNGSTWATLTSGKHKITALDPQSNTHDESWVTVKSL